MTRLDELNESLGKSQKAWTSYREECARFGVAFLEGLRAYFGAAPAIIGFYELTEEQSGKKVFGDVIAPIKFSEDGWCETGVVIRLDNQLTGRVRYERFALRFQRQGNSFAVMVDLPYAATPMTVREGQAADLEACFQRIFYSFKKLYENGLENYLKGERRPIGFAAMSEENA